MVIGGLAGRSCSWDFEALSLARVLRAEVVDLRAEVAEGLHSSACGEAIACAYVLGTKIDAGGFILSIPTAPMYCETASNCSFG